MGAAKGAITGLARKGMSVGGAVEPVIDNFLETVKQKYGYSLWLKVERKSCEKCCVNWFLQILGAPRESGEWKVQKSLWVRCDEGTYKSIWGVGAYDPGSGPSPEQFTQCVQRAYKALD